MTVVAPAPGLAWPVPADVIATQGLSPGADGDALDAALDAAVGWCRANAARQFTDAGPAGPAAWQAVCKAAALEYRGRGVDYGIGYPDSATSTEPGGDGWQGVRRLLGIGYYTRPRIG